MNGKKFIVFESENDLRKYLEKIEEIDPRSRSLSKEEINETIQHEKDHYEKATPLGYNAKYGMEIITQTPIVFIEKKFNTLKEKRDMALIALAPKESSPSDFKLSKINYTLENLVELIGESFVNPNNNNINRCNLIKKPLLCESYL